MERRLWAAWMAAAVTAFALAACGGGADRSKANVRFVNASSGYAALDARVDDERRFASVAYGQGEAYLELDPDADAIDTDVTRPGSTTPLVSLTPAVSKSRAVCIFINQVREKIGIMFGNPEVTPGGRALKFFSTVRMEVRARKGEKTGEKDAEEQKSNIVTVKIVKNKVAPPFRKAQFEMVFGKGICKEGEILDLADEAKIVQRSGAWYSYNDTRMGQGRENAKEFLAQNPDVLGEIAGKLRTKLGMANASPEVASEEQPAPEKARSAGKGK